MTLDPILDFSGKVALITGAASGFGKLLAMALSERGAQLVISDINEAGVQEVAGELPGDVIAMRCDVAREADCKAQVEAALELFGRLDIAVNNAGIALDFVPFHVIEEEIIDRQFDINVKGVMFGMKHQLAVMRDQGVGTILNVSSMAGLGAGPRIAPYAAAKHAVVGVTRTAAVEYARHGVRVNAICPFFTTTPMVTESTHARGKSDEQVEAELCGNSPMRRLGKPEEIVAVMLMLLSPANSFMTGQAIAVDGGMSAI